MTAAVIVIGDGGYARTVVDVLRLCGTRVLGCSGVDGTAPDGYALPVPYLGNDDTVLAMPREGVLLVNAIGSVGPPIARRAVFERFKQVGFEFACVVHPGAVVADEARLSEGVHVHANATLQPGVTVGEDSIVDYNVGVGHDSFIGAHVHLAPGAVLSGNVRIGDVAHIGTGAVIIQGISVGAGVMVAAGAVVIRPVAPGDVVMGMPARSRAG